MTSPHLTILFDNEPGLPELTTLWGFAALIRLEGCTVLFDTGSNGRVLLRNMATLGLAPETVDLVFLSHPHWDHMGGLDSLLERNPEVTVVLHEGFSKHLIHDLRTLCRKLLVVGPDPCQLAPGVFSTGLLESQPAEQGLVIDADGITAAISGCAHPGMEHIVERATPLLGRAPDWAIGGFHLMYADAAAIDRSVRAVQDLGVRCVVPTHCTGEAARAAFMTAFGERCFAGGVGRAIRLDACGHRGA
ncbi:MBL fold metallo-hydrolase [Thiococcus pfennigii]|uniref:MBL fold metallo-hydrolase n=1 Tax=Thiococcus pfennigii TaxID=1057 RepID=UPI0019057B79|nr:MBL fold metallo-hydrolase [Thiococcus pfennigii]MBK1700079.1 metal-dependent hydrolase [Thiococcus pfennigii]